MRYLLVALLLAVPAFADDSYDVVKLATDVYAIEWREMPIHPEPNVTIIINSRDVVVVDTSIFPSTAKTIIAEIRKLTPKPVRYVINTHWHDDHVFGNATFREAWPGVEFIAHPNTRIDAAAEAFGKIPEDLTNNQKRIDEYKAMLKPDLTPEKRKGIDYVLEYSERYKREIPSVHELLPDVLVTDSITLDRDGHAIEIHYLGRGNTRGDVVVWLPKEKILATGDLVVAPSPFGMESYYSDWVGTLDRMMKFDATTVVLSHGPVQHDLTYVRSVRDLLQTLVEQVKSEVAKGATLEEVKQRVKLSSWRDKLANDLEKRCFDAFFLDPAVEGAYKEAKGEPRA
jgi:cyclase